MTTKNAGLSGNGALCDVAPTILDLMGLPIPSEMTGKSLLTKSETKPEATGGIWNTINQLWKCIRP